MLLERFRKKNVATVIFSFLLFSPNMLHKNENFIHVLYLRFLQENLDRRNIAVEKACVSKEQVLSVSVNSRLFNSWIVFHVTPFWIESNSYHNSRIFFAH